MKYLFFVIGMLLIMIPLVHAQLTDEEKTSDFEKTPNGLLIMPDLYNVHNTIVCGMVIGKDTDKITQMPEATSYMEGSSYSIKIEKYFKNSSLNATIDALGSEDSNGPKQMLPFEIGQIGLFYIDKIDEKIRVISPDSIKVKTCKSIHVVSPLKQIKSGIPIDQITCKQGLVLVTKSTDNSPACVKLDTATKLIQGGWIKNESKSSVIPSSVNCDVPFEEKLREEIIFENRTGIAKNYPYLLFMKENSSGKICVNYQTERSLPVQAKIYQENTPSDLVTIKPNIDSVQGNSTVVYSLNSTSNGKFRILALSFCPGLPLVVGNETITLNDFEYLKGTYFGCYSINTKIVGLENIKVKYFPQEYKFDLGPEMNSSIISTLESNDAQKIHYTLEIKNPKVPINISFAPDVSNLVKFKSDPLLKKLNVTDNCSWIIDNDAAIDGIKFLPILSQKEIKIQSKNVRIEPNTTGQFIMDVFVKKLPENSFYALELAMYSYDGEIKPSNIAPSSLTSYYPIIFETGKSINDISGSCRNG